jgi:hypothetical protein
MQSPASLVLGDPLSGTLQAKVSMGEGGGGGGKEGRRGGRRKRGTGNQLEGAALPDCRVPV